MCLIYEFSSCLVVQFTKMDPEEEKVLAKRRRDAERKRLQRAAYSQEKKDEIKKKCREHMRKIRSERNAMQNEHDRKKRCIASSNMEEGKKESIRKKRREYMAAVRANMTDKELEEGRKLGRQRAAAARANMTQEELEERRDQNNERNRLARYEASMVDRCERSTVAHNAFQWNMNASMPAFNISEHICIEESVERCQEHLLRTVISPEETGYKNNEEVHKAPVCVTCDCSIIGVDSFIWISSQCLKYHENVLSSDYYYTEGINPILKEQYTVEDGLISHLLLSPRARKRHDINSYMCCSSCYSVLAEMTKLKKPPKYAISNGFAIGHLPNRFTHNISPMLNNLVAPVRAFNYFVSFTGGKEQRITGNFGNDRGNFPRLCLRRINYRGAGCRFSCLFNRFYRHPISDRI